MLIFRSYFLIGLCALFLTACQEKKELSPESRAPITVTPIPSDHFGAALDAEFARVSPTANRWSTEAFEEKASAQLKTLGRLLASGEKPASLSLLQLFSKEAQLSILRPKKSDLVREFFSDQFLVYRSTPTCFFKPSFQNPAIAFYALTNPLSEFGPLHFKFKIIGITPDENSIKSHVLVVISSNRKSKKGFRSTPNGPSLGAIQKLP